MPLPAEPLIRVTDLDVVFGHGAAAVHAVRGASFTVARGETFGLVGESGSGKSTILGAISGLIDHWSGAITLDSQALGRRRDRGFHRSVQMVFQDPYASLHPRHTVDRVLSEPMLIHGMGNVDERVLAMLDDVGLGPSFRFRYPHQLSGGQRQRVAVARALMSDPGVLLLDEPTSALDVSVQAEILNLLKRIKIQRRLTFIIVSHDLAVIAHMCDRMAVMNDGRIVEQMTVEQLRASAPEQPYTRQLLRASAGYDRSLAKSLDVVE